MSERHLTERQARVLALVRTGHTNGQIAERLHVHERVVARDVRVILTEMGVTSRRCLWDADQGKRKCRRCKSMVPPDDFADEHSMCMTCRTQVEAKRIGRPPRKYDEERRAYLEQRARLAERNPGEPFETAPGFDWQSVWQALGLPQVTTGSRT